MTTHDNETDAERTARNGQLTQADVQTMTAAKDYDGITKAQAEGRLNVLLGGVAPLPTDRQLTAEEVSAAFADKLYAQIEAARIRGQLDNLLDPTKEN